MPFLFLLCFKWVHYVLHLHVIVFSFIPSGLLKILREERQDHPNNRQNSRPFSLCCCIILGIELDNFILCFSPPPETLSNHLTGHPSPSLMRACDSHISSQVSMHVSPTEEGQIHHHYHHRRRLQSTALLSRHRHHHPHQQDNHHNQCNKCQSFVQPSAHASTHDDASPVSSYIFLEKGNKTTSKFNASFNRRKVELPLFFS